MDTVNTVRANVNAFQNGRDPNAKPSGLSAQIPPVQVVDDASLANVCASMASAETVVNSVSFIVENDSF